MQRTRGQKPLVGEEKGGLGRSSAGKVFSLNAVRNGKILQRLRTPQLMGKTRGLSHYMAPGFPLLHGVAWKNWPASLYWPRF